MQGVACWFLNGGGGKLVMWLFSTNGGTILTADRGLLFSSILHRLILCPRHTIVWPSNIDIHAAVVYWILGVPFEWKIKHMLVTFCCKGPCKLLYLVESGFLGKDVKITELVTPSTGCI